MPLVAWLCEFPTLSGGEYSLLSTLDELHRSGFSIRAIAPPEGRLADALRRRDIDVSPLSLHDAAGVRRSQKQCRAHLAQHLERLQPDLLHANSLSMGRLSGPVAAQQHLASIAHLRDIIRLSPAAIADLNRHQRILAVSEATRTAHVANGLDGDKTHVLYNGVDLERFRPRASTGSLRAELALGDDAVLIGTVGQLIMRKGLDALAHAAAQLATRLPQAHYVLVGERYSSKREAVQYEHEVRDVFAAAGLIDRVHFLGVRSDVPKLMNEFDLLVHPARQEPLGRVLLEAAASGLPIIATDVGGTPEIFPPDLEAARLVPPHDPAALAAAIFEVATTVDLAQRLGSAARRRAEAAFDIRSAAAGLVHHYQEVLAEAGRSSGCG